MTEKEKNLIDELGLDKNPSVSLNVCETGAPLKESSDSEVISSDEPSSLSEEAEKVSSEKKASSLVYLTINEMPNASPSRLHKLCAYLKRETSFALVWTMYIDMERDSFWVYELGEALAESTSLKSFSLAINIYRNIDSLWVYKLGEAFAKSISLNSLTLAINNYSDIDHLWVYELGEALAESTSLNSLKLAINNYGDSDSDSHWGQEYLYGLKRIKPLTECSFTFNICGKCRPDLL